MKVLAPHPSLSKFIAPYANDIQELFWQLRQWVITELPGTNELIWDNYNALAIAYSRSEQLKDACCHIALYAKHVNLGFNRGAELSPNALKLQGSGKLIRHINLRSFDDLDLDSAKDYLLQADLRALELNPTLANYEAVPTSIVMSISEKKNRPS